MLHLGLVIWVIEALYLRFPEQVLTCYSGSGGVFRRKKSISHFEKVTHGAFDKLRIFFHLLYTIFSLLD